MIEKKKICRRVSHMHFTVKIIKLIYVKRPWEKKRA